jgi:site-specific recombinase XerD
VSLAVVRSVESARSLRGSVDAEDFEQELIDQFSLAMSAVGITDEAAAADRRVVFEFAGFLGRPLWTAQVEDADRFLRSARRERGLAKSTVAGKATALAKFYEFVIVRYQGDIHAVFDQVVVQPIDEFNRPRAVRAATASRVPPRVDEVRGLFESWSEALPEARKYLPAARDYLAASLWRRLGLRINETVMLDVGDWHPELGERGKLHVRHGKGSRGRGAKVRLVPAIDEVDALLEWWLTDVRHQFGDDYDDPAAPLLPSERRDPMTGHCTRISADPLRTSLAGAVQVWLPDWAGQLSPHVLRHFCASHLYEQGMTLKAIQELMGHSWLSTTTQYIHVHDNHIEQSWAAANDRALERLGHGTGHRIATASARDPGNEKEG